MVRVVGVLRMVRVVRDGWSWRGTVQKSKKSGLSVTWFGVL